jgi:hypothetical protein
MSCEFSQVVVWFGLWCLMPLSQYFSYIVGSVFLVDETGVP